MFKRTRKRQIRKRTTRRRRQRGGSAAHIPRICFQTSKDPIKPYIVERLEQYLNGFHREYYSDADIMKFFRDNRHPKYPEDALVKKFHSFTSGEHRADLFRYYHLLLKGGIFIDSDLMIYTQLAKIIGNHQFVSVNALQPVGSVFNGFLAATPGHPIIQDAMDDIMKVENSTLQSHYHFLVAKMGTFVDKHKGRGVHLLKEINNNNKSCDIVDSSGDVVMVHYQNMDPPKFPLQHSSP